MKTVPAVSLIFLFGVTSCDRISSLFGHGESSGGATSAPSASSAAATPPVAPADVLAGFEGEIDLSAKDKTRPAPIALSLLVKNDVIHVDAPADLLSTPDVAKFTGGGKVYALLRTAEKKAIVVFDSKREAVTIDLDGLGDKMKAFRGGAPGGAPAAPPPEPPKVTKTGKTETVAGYSCEDWEILNADKSKFVACVADKGASFFHFPITGIPTEHAWALELMDGQHFPLRGVAFDRTGVESGRVEVTKLDKRTLDASQFEIPAGYKQVTIEEFLGSLGGAEPPGDVPKKERHPPHGPHHHGHRQQ